MSKPMILGGGGGELLETPLAEMKIEDLAKLFLEAAKPDTQWYLGLEIELFAFSQADLRPAGHDVIARILETLSGALDMERSFETNGALTGLSGHGQLVSLEPGGQLEFASSPHRSLQKLRNEVVDYGEALKAAAAEQGVGFWALGQQPFVDRDGAPHMPKPRYDQMRRYLGQRGARALDMMHLTGSVQCTVDFQSERNLVDKVRTAAKASPFLSALVAASPFTLGKPNGFKTVRYQIWLETDDDRCGIWPEMVDETGLTVERYIERTLRVPPMFLVRDGEYVDGGTQTFARLMETGVEGRPLTVRDYLDHLTSFFPEIRPKGYVEMRGADCLLPAEAVAVGGFWRGILDDEPTRAAVDARLEKMDYAAIRQLQADVAVHALDADSAAGPVREVILEIVGLAYERLQNSAPDCAECVLPLLERAQRGVCPADEMLQIAAERGVPAALETVRL